jgi:hypothetical protein
VLGALGARSGAPVSVELDQPELVVAKGATGEACRTKRMNRGRPANSLS